MRPGVQGLALVNMAMNFLVSLSGASSFCERTFGMHGGIPINPKPQRTFLEAVNHAHAVVNTFGTRKSTMLFLWNCLLLHSRIISEVWENFYIFHKTTNPPF
jgi:hypothetical protein